VVLIVTEELMKPTVVSLFSGAGGLDVGLETAGFAVVYCNDIDADCIATLQHNKRRSIPSLTGDAFLRESIVECADIAAVTGSGLRAHGVPLEVDLLVGGPPCQPFSSAGRMLSFRDNRGTLYTHFVRLAKELRPKYILFENVRGLATARDIDGPPGSALEAILRDFQALGYRTNIDLLNLADFGGWQRRVRLFILMAREATPPGFPEPTHCDPRKLDEQASLFGVAQLQPWRRLGDFLAQHGDAKETDYTRPTSRLASLLRDVPDGSGLRSAGTREATRPGGHWGYRQGTFIADPALPARTVTAASTQDWVRVSDGSLRRLTIEECKLLQSFPKDWEFIGSRASRFRQVGNAVPSLFGELLGHSILRHRSAWYHRGFQPEPGSRSHPLPKQINDAIKYTLKEQERNGHSRRLKLAKGLGRNDPESV
jgi:DNA (cytosine-5)-methyltransferase 1